jgi:predicted nucleotidyltransferase
VIHWEQLGLSITVKHLLAGRRSNESPASPAHWLQERQDGGQRTGDLGATTPPSVSEEFWHKLQEFVQKLGEQHSADRIILFGSHAQGRAAPDSDVDLLIVADSDLPRLKRLQNLYASAPRRDFPVDLLWYTPEEIEEHAGQNLTLVGRILQDGIVLYEQSH